jgi:hypothetical protein
MGTNTNANLGGTLLDVLKRPATVASAWALVLTLSACGALAPGGNLASATGFVTVAEACDQVHEIVPDEIGIVNAGLTMNEDVAIGKALGYILIDVRSEWDDVGMGSVELTCLLTEMGLSQPVLESLKDDGTFQKMNQKLFSLGLDGLTARIEDLEQNGEVLEEQALANAFYNEERLDYLAGLKAGYARRCTVGYPGDSYKCNNSEDFADWINYVGCRVNEGRPKNDGFCTGTSNWNDAWLLPEKGALKKEISKNAERLESAESALVQLSALESADKSQLNLLGVGDLRQSWTFSPDRGLILVLALGK